MTILITFGPVTFLLLKTLKTATYCSFRITTDNRSQLMLMIGVNRLTTGVHEYLQNR